MTAAADRAADSGFDALAKGPQETFVRRNTVAGSGGFHYVSYDRTFRGLPVLGGDAVVVTDARGAVRGTASAIRRGINLKSLTPVVSLSQASLAARGQLALSPVRPGSWAVWSDQGECAESRGAAMIVVPGCVVWRSTRTRRWTRIL